MIRQNYQLHTHQFIVIDNHQLDVFGLSLDGALPSPHLDGAKEKHKAKCFSPLS